MLVLLCDGGRRNPIARAGGGLSSVGNRSTRIGNTPTHRELGFHFKSFKAHAACHLRLRHACLIETREFPPDPFDVGV